MNIRWTGELVKEVVALRGQGLTYREIAERIGGNIGSVQYCLRQFESDPEFYLESNKDARRRAGMAARIQGVRNKRAIMPSNFCNGGEIVAGTDDGYSPLQMAIIHLGTRFEDKDNRFLLDGRECGLNDVMRATNKVLAGLGSKQVLNNPAWRWDV